MWYWSFHKQFILQCCYYKILFYISLKINYFLNSVNYTSKIDCIKQTLHISMNLSPTEYYEWQANFQKCNKIQCDLAYCQWALRCHSLSLIFLWPLSVVIFFPFLKLHATTSTGFSCHYTRKIKWLINLEINSQLMFGIFKYSACKHEKLQHFGNVHRTKTSGRHSVTRYQTFYIKTYFITAFLVMHISQIKCILSVFWKEKCTVHSNSEMHKYMFHVRRPPYTYEGPLIVWYVAPHRPNRLTPPWAKLSVTEKPNYEGWNFNSGNYLFTTDTK